MKKFIIVFLATVMALSVVAVCVAADAVPLTAPSGVNITLSGYTLLRGHLYTGINGQHGRFAVLRGGQIVEGQTDSGQRVRHQFNFVMTANEHVRSTISFRVTRNWGAGQCGNDDLDCNATDLDVRNITLEMDIPGTGSPKPIARIKGGWYDGFGIPSGKLWWFDETSSPKLQLDVKVLDSGNLTLLNSVFQDSRANSAYDETNLYTAALAWTFTPNVSATLFGAWLDSNEQTMGKAGNNRRYGRENTNTTFDGQAPNGTVFTPADLNGDGTVDDPFRGQDQWWYGVDVTFNFKPFSLYAIFIGNMGQDDYKGKYGLPAVVPNENENEGYSVYTHAEYDMEVVKFRGGFGYMSGDTEAGRAGRKTDEFRQLTGSNAFGGGVTGLNIFTEGSPYGRDGITEWSTSGNDADGIAGLDPIGTNAGNGLVIGYLNCVIPTPNLIVWDNMGFAVGYATLADDAPNGENQIGWELAWQGAKRLWDNRVLFRLGASLFFVGNVYETQITTFDPATGLDSSPNIPAERVDDQNVEFALVSELKLDF